MAPHAERGFDIYGTAPEAVHALLAVEPLSGTIWEPACGPGSIVRVLRKAGLRVIATDLVDCGCPDSQSRIDFLLETKAPSGATTILTNPPYMLAAKFVRHALLLVPRVVMLLRLAFLESGHPRHEAGRARRFCLDENPPARVYVFRERLPMQHRKGWDGPFASSALAFAWFSWDRDHRGPTTLSRISWKARHGQADLHLP